MVYKTAFALVIIMVISLMSIGQDCGSPLTLCNETTFSADASQFTEVFSSGCLTASNATYYEFTTNNNGINPSAFIPYEVSAEIIVNQCEEAGVPLNLSAAIFQPVDATDPCGALNEIVACETSLDTINLNTGVLAPNTQYFLVLGYSSALMSSVCDVEVTLSGAPLTIDACCDANIPAGLSVDLFVTGGSFEFGSETYVWQPLQTVDDFSSNNPVATPSVTTNYTVEGEVGNCITTDQVTITVGDAIDVKNTFTPNGDGINDTWTILRIENFDSALITVFNRWGQEVYKTIGYASPWDGTNDGKTLPTGTYYYVIELNSLEVSSEPFAGFVFISH